MEPALRTCDAETVEFLNKLCLDMPVTQEDALALGVALLVELQKRRPLRRCNTPWTANCMTLGVNSCTASPSCGKNFSTA
jgi:hypothetical protein